MRQFLNQLENKLAESFKIQLSRLKQTKSNALVECQILNEKIIKELQKIKQSSNLIKQGAKLQTAIYNQSLNSDNYSRQIINLSVLSNYLKKQKIYLSELVQAQEQNKPKSGKDLLHKLSTKKKFEKYLQHLECKKFEMQIEYLEKNILIGKTKEGGQNVIYEDIQSVSVKQQNELRQKIKGLLQQLERVVTLSNQCGGNQNNALIEKNLLLKKQTQRLQMIERVLDKQTKQIVQVKDYFQQYQPKQIFDALNKNQIQIQKNIGCINPPQFEQHKEDANIILNFEVQTQNLRIFKKPFEQVNDTVKLIKNKLKKIKI